MKHRKSGPYKLYAVIAGALPIILTTCDPCGIALGCAQWPRAAVVGQVMNELTGRPMSGVRVEMRRQDGVELEHDTATTVTGTDGLFQLESAAVGTGDATVMITIRAPDQFAYDVPNVRVRATVKTGEATVLAPWSSARPTLPYVLQLSRNGTNDERVANTGVAFRRTSGGMLFFGSEPVPIATGTTSDVGWVYLFRGLTADRAGPVIGDLIVYLPEPLGPAVIPGVSFEAVPLFRPTDSFAALGVGPS